ncbi:MAG: hypothetical protein LBE35_05985 [Clostridiales bacterium]|nr:hypothetical protein [Clostridiales bacterium]
MKRLVALALIVIITGVLAACGRAPEIVETPRLGNPGNFERADVGADFSPIITDNFTPAVSLAYLAFTDEVERLGAGALNGLNYANTREEIADFIIDMVHPISSSDILNDITLHKITDVVDNFIASNSSGSIFGRPRSYSYNGQI